ncbi:MULTISPECIES: molybdopterin converting factor subunit 1 [Paracoccus]|uniref:molybdopterin converting factor subunit 1 n=1 Tax=Paracoccus TaxID=265 RepID=UPI00091D26D1|nr:MULTISPECIES: molybdopterin converting factor subunit 1 [Paracoccus]OJH44727.1 molybdenum cofactor biosynthesis protein MoaD [Paracoccus sp. SM22M-07]
MTLEVLYFAWLRERVGQPRETVTTDAATVRELIAELTARSDGHAAAFADMASLRCAVDQQLADLDSPIGSAREIAFFPPMTGG